MTVLAQSDDIQEQVENVTLMFTIGDSCLESVVAGNPSEATVTITDTTESECLLHPGHLYTCVHNTHLVWYSISLSSTALFKPLLSAISFVL